MTERTGLTALLEDFGFENIRRTGNEVGARCPLHEDRTGYRERRPRHWSINVTTGLHHCWSCNWKGNLFTLIRDVAGVGPAEAQVTIWRYEIDLKPASSDAGNTGHTDQPVDPWASERNARQLRQQYERFGDPHQHALSSRHISLESCGRFGVRWDEYREGWVQPVFSAQGMLTGWQFKRSLTDGFCLDEDGPERDLSPQVCTRRGTKVSQTCFGLEHVLANERLLLVESPLDVVYLYELGYPAVASFGTDTVSDRQLALIRERTSHLVLALDNDIAGHQATESVLNRGQVWDLRFERLEVLSYRPEIRDIKDPGEMNEQQLELALISARDARGWLVDPYR
jgi:hypothetical protein